MAAGGLDTSHLSPDDARAAVASLARRIAAVITGFGEDEDPEALVRRPPAPGEPSALDAALAAVQVMSWARATVDTLVRTGHPPVLAPPGAFVVEPLVRPGASVASVLDRLALESAALVGRIASTSPDDWQRAGTLTDGTPLSAIEAVRGAVRSLTADLRRAEAAVEAARRTR